MIDYTSSLPYRQYLHSFSTEKNIQPHSLKTSVSLLLDLTMSLVVSP